MPEINSELRRLIRDSNMRHNYKVLLLAYAEHLEGDVVRVLEEVIDRMARQKALKLPLTVALMKGRRSKLEIEALLPGSEHYTHKMMRIGFKQLVNDLGFPEEKIHPSVVKFCKSPVKQGRPSKEKKEATE